MYTSPSGGLAPPPTGSPPPVLDYLPLGVCISVKRGQTLNVRLINALGPNSPPSDANGPLASEAITFYPGNGFRGAPVTNRWHWPNSTNLHTHGARVSALSPGDDILIHVEPETDFNYSYDFADYHAPGTLWYHPHSHGSTALQAGGGLAGPLLVADEADDVPQYVLDLPEEIVLVTHVPMVDDEVYGQFGLPTIAALSNDTLMANNLVPGPVDFFLVNGDLNPIIELDEGAFTRMRFIFSSIQVGVNIRWVAH